MNRKHWPHGAELDEVLQVLDALRDPTDAEVIEAICAVPCHFADAYPPNWPVSDVNAEFTHKASEANSVGDLLWYDVANHCLRPAAQFLDLGTQAATLEAFALVFAGVANSKQLSTDATAENARTLIDRIWEYPCASGTFAVGDYVAPSYTTTGAGVAGCLSNQLLIGVGGDASQGIGRVVKEYQSATLAVKCRLTAGQLNGRYRQAAAGAEAEPLLTLSGAADAINPHVSHTYVVTKAGVDAMTLAAPTATTDDGVQIMITSATTNAHTLTATGLLQTGTASVNVATFAAQKGAGLSLMAYQGKWQVMSSVGITFS